MTLDYARVWEKMNELESVASKVCSAREILECAIEALESGKREKAETLMYAADEFLQYYLNEFDEKFKVAWKETVTKLKYQEYDTAYKGDSIFNSNNESSNDFLFDNMNNSYSSSIFSNSEDIIDPAGNVIDFCGVGSTDDYCKGAWTSFWEENYYPEEYEKSKYYYEYDRNDLNRENPFEVKEDKVIKWRLPVEADGPSGEYFITFPDDLLEAANLKEGDEVHWVDNGDGSYTLQKVTKSQ